MTGPLAGLRVVELGSIGPGPHAAMVLADLGADVVRIDRPGTDPYPIPVGVPDPMLRGRRSVALDLKQERDRETLLELAAVADVLIEGYRPGVAERLGVGPQECHARNSGLIYARVTGWGQQGPLAQRAGHDINYLSLTGNLQAIGRRDGRPVPPLNLVADFGGGSMLALVGILAAIFERGHSGQGQVVDVAMTDGAGLLAQMIWTYRGVGAWSDERGVNLLDGGAPFYDTYECADGKYLAVGAIEPAFFRILCTGLELPYEESYDHTDREGWPELRSTLTRTIATRPRDEWATVFAGTDGCVTPVLDFAEAPQHPQLAAREAFIELGGIVQPAPAPRFSRTPAGRPTLAPESGAQTAEVITQWLGRTPPNVVAEATVAAANGSVGAG
ncbi:alpha-methylacyl-CoA racemase [Jatrophihabitans sp. GAS493]|uniref:CaiB/BaiF CoA transferase family protein n=1 Tax=Jatrophihabitans sp. GAS493 TaxID=1907575 RepID=UPI000BB8585A|nr:CaiB/BaiF CoA-transferase family protein [Jatrophihabitans sp. GAS493]SOD74643.1 alpha-methylacyl-CoA racemase [Jatrophihabitans sp. GAS493]